MRKDVHRLVHYENLSIINRIKVVFYRIRKRRSKNLCEICPDDIRGTCCIFSIHIEAPHWGMCERCSEYIRSGCIFPKDKITEKIVKYNIMLPNHPCKFLDPKTKLCTVFPNRFERNHLCRTIKEGLRTGIWHPQCIYVRKNKKYLRGIVKVSYEDVEDKLCAYGKAEFKMANETAHQILLPSY